MRRRRERFLDSRLCGWIVKTAEKHYWRVAAWYDLDDLIQDGYIAFALCRQKYADRVENQRHFMALFKRVYTNMITDIANKHSGRDGFVGGYEVAVSQIAVPGRENTALEFLGGSEPADAEFLASMKDAPAEILQLMTYINEGYLSGEVHRKKPTGGRETTNEFLNRHLGTINFDFEGELRQFLYA